MQAYDVIICGGGLAGLSLARQLRRASSDLRIAVIEKSSFPSDSRKPEVGESTVEGAAHYLGQKLGLHEYLSKTHLMKNGPRFFCGNARAPLISRNEIGSKGFPRLPSYQLDRDVLAERLSLLNQESDIAMHNGYVVREIEIDGSSMHRVFAEGSMGRGELRVRAKWVVDALGRRRFLQHRFGFTRNNRHRIAAAWLHLAETLDVNEFVSPSEWHTRDPDGLRSRSTCFFVGRGYWVWLIVLGSGRTSIGVVAERNTIDYRELLTLENLQLWLRKREPVLAEQLEHKEVLDFRALPDLSYSSRRVISADRWACVGDAGVFLDPLYSPGIDMIGLGNSMVADLIVKDCRSAGVQDAQIEEYNSFYLNTTRTYLKTFRTNYPVFGNPYVFMAKLYWDTLLYWIFFAPIQIYDVFKNVPACKDAARKYALLESRMQALFRFWSERCNRVAPDYTPYPPAPSSILTETHVELDRERTPAEAAEYIQNRLSLAEAAACAIIVRASADLATHRLEEIRQAEGLNPYRIGLDADAWRQRGFFEPHVRDYSHMEMELKYYYGEMSAAQYGTVRKLLALKSAAGGSI